MSNLPDNVAPFPVAVDRQLPCEIEAERAIIGTVMLNNSLIDQARVLRPQEFYLEAHRHIFAAMVTLADIHSAIDAVTIGAALTAAGKFEAAGGQAALNALDFAMMRLDNIEHYIELVRRAAQRRALMHVAARITDAAMDLQKPITDTLVETEHLLAKVSDATITESGCTIAEAGAKWIDRIKQIREKKTNPGITTEFPRLDRMTGGWQGGHMIVLASRPKVGKTSMALQFAQHAAELGHPVLFCSLEMSAEELTKRLLCSQTDTDGHKATWGYLSDVEFASLVDANSVNARLAIRIEDSQMSDVTIVRAKIRKFCRENRGGKLPLILLDYLQLLGSTGKAENRTQELTRITRMLKTTARDENVPMIVLSQLNRASEHSSREPALHDLRESGSIEQDADLVMLLHPQKSDEQVRHVQSTKLIVAANRHGPNGFVPTLFFGQATRFQESTE